VTDDGGDFKGFSRQALDFLSELERNNNRTWFEDHRSAYDLSLLPQALAFVAALGAALRESGAKVAPEPRLGGSLFRIHRDVRFSRDKRPYKTHVGIRIRGPQRASSGPCVAPVYYVEFDARRLVLGVGIKEFDPQSLRAYRRAVAAQSTLAELAAIVRRAENEGHQVIGELTSRVPTAPSGKDGGDLLRRKGLFVRQQSALPPEIRGKGFVRHCARWFDRYHDLHEALCGLAPS